MASLADYALCSDQSQFNSRLEESFHFFRTLLATPAFAKKPICLVLSKFDIFEKQLSQTPFSEMFEDYDGENAAAAVVEYITARFRKCSRVPEQISKVLSTSLLPDSSANIVQFISEFARTAHALGGGSARAGSSASSM